MRTKARGRGHITKGVVAARLAAVLTVCVALRSAAGVRAPIPDRLGVSVLALTLPGAAPEAPDPAAAILSATLPGVTPDTAQPPAASRVPDRARPGKLPSRQDAAPSDGVSPSTETSSPSTGSAGENAPSRDEGEAASPVSPGGDPDGAATNDAIGTTITGTGSGYQNVGEGIYLKNRTDYEIDVEEYLSKPLAFSAPEAAVLIIHTHGSEAYNPAGDDIYVPSDPSRTEDKSFNVVRVGDELEKVLTERGVTVIHDRELYDYPSYAGSYDRSMESIRRHLKEHPEIKAVIDLHRDALEGDGKLYKTVADVGDSPCAQVMLICGTNFSGLDHPNWRDNLTFALKIQREMVADYPTLARPLKLSEYRYNQNATTGSLIAEIGTNGNTLQEALTAVRYFGECLADVLTTG